MCTYIYTNIHTRNHLVKAQISTHVFIPVFVLIISLVLEHIGWLVRMSVLDTEVDGSNPGNSMLFP